MYYVCILYHEFQVCNFSKIDICNLLVIFTRPVASLAGRVKWMHFHVLYSAGFSHTRTLTRRSPPISALETSVAAGLGHRSLGLYAGACSSRLECCSPRLAKAGVTAHESWPKLELQHTKVGQSWSKLDDHCCPLHNAQCQFKNTRLVLFVVQLWANLNDLVFFTPCTFVQLQLS